MSDTPRMPEGVTPTPDSEQETFQSQVKRLTSLTQSTADNTEDMDSLLREELEAIRELKGIARKDVDQSKELHQKETQKQDREKRQETREKQQKQKTEEERHQGLTSKLSEGFRSVSKNVAQSVSNAGKNLGEEALNMALGPMRLITEPLQELTGIGVKDIGAGAFSLGKRMLSRGESTEEQLRPNRTTADVGSTANDLQPDEESSSIAQSPINGVFGDETQQIQSEESPSSELDIRDITFSPDFIPEFSPFIDQSSAQEYIDNTQNITDGQTFDNSSIVNQELTDQPSAQEAEPIEQPEPRTTAASNETVTQEAEPIEQPEPKTTTASNEAVTQEAEPIEQPSPEMDVRDITVSPDFVPQPSPFIDQSVTQEAVDNTQNITDEQVVNESSSIDQSDSLLNLEETTIGRERVRPRRSQLLQEGSIGAVGVYLGDILEEGDGPSVERDDEDGGVGGVVESVLGYMGGAGATSIMSSITPLLVGAAKIAIPIGLAALAGWGLAELVQLLFGTDHEQIRQEIGDREEASSDLEEAHDEDMGALHDTGMQAQERISDADFESYDPGMYSSHMPTVEDSENPFQDVEIPEDEIQPLHPAAILSQIAVEHPDSLALIETYAQEGDYEAAQEEYERAAPRSIPEPIFEASDPSLIVPFLQGEEVDVPEHTGMGDSELPQDETYVGYSVQDFGDAGYPYDLLRDEENRRLLVEMSKEHGREGTEDLIMEHEPDGFLQGGLGNAFDKFLESGEASQYVDDAIIRPDGEIIHTHPDDTLIATQNEVHDMSADNAIEPMMESRSLDQDINENFNRFVDQEGEVSFRESEEMISVLNQIRDAINNKPFNNIIQQMQSDSNIDKEAVRQGAL